MAKKKKKKSLRLEIHSGEYDNAPNMAVLEDPTILVSRIKQLHQACRDLDVAHISDYNFDLSFLVEDFDTEKLKAWEGRTECTQLIVGRVYFWWEGLFKHTDCRWDTDMYEVEKFLVEYAPLDELPLLLSVLKNEESIKLLRERLST